MSNITYYEIHNYLTFMGDGIFIHGTDIVDRGLIVLFFGLLLLFFGLFLLFFVFLSLAPLSRKFFCRPPC